MVQPVIYSFQQVKKVPVGRSSITCLLCVESHSPWIHQCRCSAKSSLLTSAAWNSSDKPSRVTCIVVAWANSGRTFQFQLPNVDS